MSSKTEMPVSNQCVRSRTKQKHHSKNENKITKYFSPAVSNADTSEKHEASGLANGVDAQDAVSSEFTNALVLSMPNKQNEKVENGLLLQTHTTSSVCTRSQSQKLMPNLAPSDKSPKKDAQATAINGSIPDAKSLLKYSSPSKLAKGMKTPPPSPTLHKDGNMDGTNVSPSPQSGPPTPHKIQALNEAKLRLDSPLTPSSLSSLKIISPRKLKLSNQILNVKRKLPTESNAGVSTSATGNCKATAVELGNKPAVNGALKSQPKPLKNSQMTQFFPIRRSHRKPKTTLLQEKQKEIEEKILSGKEEGLEVESFDSKGRGVKTTRLFRKGEMVVEYVGNLIDVKEAKEREKTYSSDTSKGCYMYYFTFQNTQYCIDATEESGYLGRLVNHSRNGNLATKAVEVNGQPHLILMAKKDLEPGTEILYDYGDRSKQSLENHPWLAL